MAMLAFRREPPLTRAQQVARFRETHQDWLAALAPEQREVVDALIEKYQRGGVDEITNPRIFRLPPSNPWANCAAWRSASATPRACAKRWRRFSADCIHSILSRI